MESAFPTRSGEAEPRFVVAPPAAETLLNLGAENSPWPAEVRENPLAIEAAEKRREIVAGIEEGFAALPDERAEVWKTVEAGEADVAKVAKLYSSIADLLGEPENRRAALYVPFEVLPPASWRPKDAALDAARARFAGAYMDRWWEEVGAVEARANFANGDIPDEVTAGVLINKAAHLAPKLVEKGLLAPREFLGLLEENRGSVLAASLADAVPMLIEARAFEGGDRVRAETALEARPANRPAPRFDPSPNRAAWLAREEEAAARRAEASSLVVRLKSGLMTPASARQNLGESAESREAAVVVMAVGQAAEAFAAQGRLEEARGLVGSFSPLRGELAAAQAEAADALEGEWSRLKRLGVASGDTVGKFSVAAPRLDGGLEDARPKMEGDIRSLEAALAAVRAHPYLAEIICPAAIATGSKLKGYGTSASDADTLLFVQPGTPREDAPVIAAALKATFAAAGVADEPQLFWLEADGDRLVVGAPASPSGMDRNLTGALFGGAWVGDSSAVADLHERLLASYLRSADSAERRLWLGDMERSALLYRLAHRGYERFFPVKGLGPHAPVDLDPQAAFWDSGYRRLATKLFAKRVFLPKLG
jgi:hypothetical protein